MNRQTFLNRLNKCLAARQIDKVSDRQLGDWLDEGLVEAPAQHGLGRGTMRNWGWQQTRQVLEVLKAKSRGPSRTSLLRIASWMNGRKFSFEVIHEDMKREFTRIWKAQNAKTKPLSYDPRNNDPPRPGQIKSTGKAVGDVDPRLVPENVKISDDDKLNFDATLRFGVGSRDAIFNYSKKIGPNLKMLKPEDIEFAQMTFIGLMGNPDEILKTAIEALNNSTFEEFKLAKQLFKYSQQMMSLSRRGIEFATKKGGTFEHQFSEELAQLKIAETALRQTQWIVVGFVGNLNAIKTDLPAGMEYLRKIEAEIANGNRFLFQEILQPKSE